MSETKVAQFAETIGTPVERLIEQMHSAGLKVESADSSISDDQKQQLLNYLQDKHGSATKATPNKITLKRKTTSELTSLSSSTKSSSRVKVEVRKKRTYVKRSELDDNIPSADAELLEARRVDQEAKATQDAETHAKNEADLQSLKADEQAKEDAIKKREAELAAHENEKKVAQNKITETREIEALARKQTRPILKEAPRTPLKAKVKAKTKVAAPSKTGKEEKKIYQMSFWFF